MIINKYTILSKIQILASSILGKVDSSDLTVTLRDADGNLSLTTGFMVKSMVEAQDDEVFGKSITVNMYQLFMIIDSADELIRINSDGDNLVVQSYFNGECDLYEMTVTLPTVTNTLNAIEVDGLIGYKNETEWNDPIVSIPLSGLYIQTLINEFFNYKNNGDIYIHINDGDITFSASKDGIALALDIFDLKVDVGNMTIKMPTNFLNVAYASHGVSINDMILNVYDIGDDKQLLYVKSDEYTVAHTVELGGYNFSQLGVADQEELFIFDTQKLSAALDLIKKVNTSTPDASFRMVINSDDEDELKLISTLSSGPMPIVSEILIGVNGIDLMDMEFDPGILSNLLGITGTQYIKALKPVGTEGQIIFHYRNAIFRKYVHYNHSEWIESQKDA